MATNEEIFEKVCAEFNDSFFEDKWKDIPEDNITKSSVRFAMRRALQSLYAFRPNPKAQQPRESDNGR